jgi:hypothetical protein
MLPVPKDSWPLGLRAEMRCAKQEPNVVTAVIGIPISGIDG